MTEQMTEQATDQTTEELDLPALMRSRAQTYGLLSRIFRSEVDREFLDELRGMRFPASTGNKKADEGYKMLYTYLKGVWDESVTELAVDYVKTFVGHGVNAFSAAYPFESVHTSERRLLMQEARDEVLAIYRENNLKRGDAWNEGEDHIALELEFMQVMAQRSADALEAGDDDAAVAALEIQADFMENHLMNWVPMLVSDIEHHASTDFYKGAGRLTLGFLETDEELLSELLEEEGE